MIEIDYELSAALTNARRAVRRKGSGGVTVGIIGNRFGVPTNIDGAGALTDGFTSRRHHWSHPSGSVTNIRCIDTHWYTGPTVPVAGPVSRTLKRYIEYPAGVFHQVLWSGAANLTLTTGSYRSDVVLSSVDGQPLTIPAGTKFWERTVNIGARAVNEVPFIIMPAGVATIGAEDSNSSTDLGNSGTMNTPTAGLNTFGSAAMTGTINAGNAKSFLIYGDSIAYGEGDITSVGAKGGSGWIARALDVNGKAYTKIAKPGQTASDASTSSALLNGFLALLDYSHVIAEHGINDIRLGTGQSALMPIMQTIYSRFPGKTILQTTMTPRSSTTDAYATTANQLPRTDGAMAELSAINAAIRAIPANVTAIIEAADAAMSARDSGIWSAPPAAVADGTHPNSTKCAAMATATAAQFP